MIHFDSNRKRDAAKPHDDHERPSIERSRIKNSIEKRSATNLDIFSILGFNNREYNGGGFGGYPTTFGGFPSVYGGYVGHGGHGGYYGGGYGNVFSKDPTVHADDEGGRYDDVVDIDIMGPSFNDFAVDDSADSIGGGDYGGSSSY